MNRQEQISQVLNNFDFKRVQEVMELKPDRWWKGSSGDVPNLDELRAFARQLLERAAEPNPMYDCNQIACGGFYALRWPWTTSEGTDCNLELLFAAESWEA